MMSDAQIIEVVKAHMEGKQIQLKGGFVTDWTDIVPYKSPHWAFDRIEYRIRPEPPNYLKGYCFPRDIHSRAHVGMVKVEQVALDAGENPLKPEPRKPREWILHMPKNGDLSVASIHPVNSPSHYGERMDGKKECLVVREVIEE